MGLGEALSIGSALAWAGGVVMYKRLGETLPPQNLNVLKNLIVLTLLVPTVLLIEGTRLPAMTTPTILLALASGTIGIAVADTLYLTALNTIGASRMGIMGNLYSPFVIALSFVFLGERLGVLQGIGFVLVSLGVLIVNGGSTARHIDPRRLRRGALYGAASILLMTIAIVMVKRVLEQQPLVWIVLLRLIGGVLGMLLLFAIRREPLLPRGVVVRWGVLACAAFRVCLRSSNGPRRDLFARRSRKNEGVYVDTRPSDDADLRANRPGPVGWVAEAARRRHAA